MEAILKTLARDHETDDNFALTNYLLQVADDTIVADDLEAPAGSSRWPSAPV